MGRLLELSIGHAQLVLVSLGSGTVLAGPDAMRDLPIRLRIFRDGATFIEGEVYTSEMRRSFEEFADCLGGEVTLPSEAFLVTGTGIVPEGSLR